MLRGFGTASVDSKGRVQVPVCHRKRLVTSESNLLVITVNPGRRCLWLYPEHEWKLTETKLAALSDFDEDASRVKGLMRSFATELTMDAQGRILIPPALREFSRVSAQVAVTGQGNKCEIWDKAAWDRQLDQWLTGMDGKGPPPSPALQSLSL